MKKFLEILLDDEGQMHITSECGFVASKDSLSIDFMDRLFKSAIRAFSSKIWKDKDQEASFAIRVLSCAEILATAEPYKMAEEFWVTMMFDFIPHYEKYGNKLKQPYGFDPKRMTKPIVGGPLNMMQVDKELIGKYFS